MLGRCAPRWILLTTIAACSEQGYTVTNGGDPPVADDQGTGAPATDSVESDASVDDAPTDAPFTEATSTCSGAGCSALSQPFDTNSPYPQRRVIRESTLGADNTRARSDCAGLGSDRIYDLDLSAFSQPVSVYVHVRASFDVSLAIETGREDDPFLVQCNEDHAPGADEAFIADALEPKPYRIVVDGERADASGEFELVVELRSPTGRCAEPPPNDRCGEATPLDPHRSVQTFFGTTACASDQGHATWDCGRSIYRELDVFYSLDLTERTQPVLVHASTRLAPTDHATVLFVTRDVLGECAEPLLCDDSAGGEPAELWANLEPGRYFIGVQSYEGSGDFGLSVELSAESCVPANDTCQTAQVIEPRLGAQTIVAWPGCGDDSVTTHCNGLPPSPDIFYRLDLSDREEPVHVRATTVRDGVTFDSLVLMADAGDTCGSELYCGDFDLWLSPGVYFLALDGYVDQQGPTELTLEISTDNPPAPADCIDERVATCARAAQESCCVGDSDECWLSFLSCGLRPEALSCLCAADPDCCGGGGPGGDECRRLLTECGTFCPDFDPVLTCREFL